MVNSYRPSQNKKYGRNHAGDSYRPDYARSYTTKRRRTDRYMPFSADTRPSAPTHTKKERVTNPSTRIHSLKKLLARDILPPEEKREKERELAGLLHDQTKARVTRTRRQITQRYHMVRFFERKKAERKLKQLMGWKKELEAALGTLPTDEPKDAAADDDDDNAMALSKDGSKREKLNELEKEVHQAQVDVNYTLYAPLGEKTNEESGVMKVVEVGHKPPMWFEVEKCMQAGDDEAAVKRRLEALRDRLPAQLETVAVRSTGETTTTMTMAGKTEEGVQTKPAWLDEDGHISPKDLDLDGDDVSDGGFFEH
ncbi:hypothetical protein DV736_g4900, partial [Chaetothyriales sp. CBS 134916]